MALLPLLVLAALGGAARAAWSDGDPGIDRWGTDMPGSPFNMSTNSTLECFTACANTPGCDAWVVNPCTKPTLCWLKDGEGTQQQASCRVSGTMSALVPFTFAPLP